MTGSIQENHGMLYMVLNTYKDGKRKPTWISTGLKAKGNRRKAQEMLNQRLATWDADHQDGIPTNDILFAD